MFVYNIKFNLKSIAKVVLLIMAILIVIFFFFSTYKIIKKSIDVKKQMQAPKIAYIQSKDYTNILKSVYENLDTYIGQKICFSGYIYKNLDFKANQFVLARDMTTSEINKTLVVGFLCESNDLKKFNEGDWVEIIGEITKGNYHGNIPIIKIKEIKKTSMPKDNLVNPPDNTYIPTSIIY